MDPATKMRLAQVHPKVSEGIQKLITTLAGEGIAIRVTQGFRSYEEQDQLYEQGRTAPGPIVTYAHAGYSWHNFGLAVDVAPFDAHGKPDWDIRHAGWSRIVALAEADGFVSGSRWGKPDWPHLQMTGVYPVTPNDQVRQLFTASSLQAVWDAAQL